MKIAPDELDLFFKKPATPPVVVASPDTTATPSCLAVAADNEVKTMQAIRLFGHLRIAEIARAVWPQASYGEQMALRTVKRLEAKEWVLRRKNSLGASSFVLAVRGARHLETLGLPCRHGRDIVGVAGATFFHRTLATRYLIERMANGDEVYGEYALAHGWAPVSREHLAQTIGKLPDGLSLAPVTSDSGKVMRMADILEVEASAKPLEELKQVIRVALRCGSWLDAQHAIWLNRLVILFDQAQNHGGRILKAADEVWAGREIPQPAELESRIILALADIRFPLTWQRYQIISLKDFRAGKTPRQS